MNKQKQLADVNAAMTKLAETAAVKTYLKLKSAQSRLAETAAADMDLTKASDQDLGYAALGILMASIEGMSSSESGLNTKKQLMAPVQHKALRSRLIGVYKKGYFVDGPLHESVDRELVKRFGAKANIDSGEQDTATYFVAKKVGIDAKLIASVRKYVNKFNKENASVETAAKSKAGNIDNLLKGAREALTKHTKGMSAAKLEDLFEKWITWFDYDDYEQPEKLTAKGLVDLIMKDSDPIATEDGLFAFLVEERILPNMSDEHASVKTAIAPAGKEKEFKKMVKIVTDYNYFSHKEHEAYLRGQKKTSNKYSELMDKTNEIFKKTFGYLIPKKGKRFSLGYYDTTSPTLFAKEWLKDD